MVYNAFWYLFKAYSDRISRLDSHTRIIITVELSAVSDDVVAFCMNSQATGTFPLQSCTIIGDLRLYIIYLDFVM